MIKQIEPAEREGGRIVGDILAVAECCIIVSAKDTHRKVYIASGGIGKTKECRYFNKVARAKRICSECKGE